MEVAGDFEMPSSMIVRIRGKDSIVPVTYDWKPKKCVKCNSFGHGGGQCSGQDEVLEVALTTKGNKVGSVGVVPSREAPRLVE